MLIKSLVIKKDYLTTVNERATLAEALKILEDSGYRCVPIVDDTVPSSVVTFIKCTSTVISHKVAI